MAASYQLIVQESDQPQKTISLLANIIAIGRDRMSDVVLNDPEVSRHHTRMIRNADGGYSVQDLGSTNGTFLDGRRLGGEAIPMKPGQSIRVGTHITIIYMKVGDEIDQTMLTSQEPFVSPFGSMDISDLEEAPPLPAFDSDVVPVPPFIEVPSIREERSPVTPQTTPPLSERSIEESVIAYDHIPDPPKDNRTRNILIGILVVGMLCCICLVISGALILIAANLEGMPQGSRDLIQPLASLPDLFM